MCVCIISYIISRMLHWWWWKPPFAQLSKSHRYSPIIIYLQRYYNTDVFPWAEISEKLTFVKKNAMETGVRNSQECFRWIFYCRESIAHLLLISIYIFISRPRDNFPAFSFRQSKWKFIHSSYTLLGIALHSSCPNKCSENILEHGTYYAWRPVQINHEREFADSR